MFKVIEAVIAVTVIAELSICEAVTISGGGKKMALSVKTFRMCQKGHNTGKDTHKLASVCCYTYSFRHCDFVQLHGFRGLAVVSAVDKL